ncbi:ATP-binding protein [Mycobacterium sp.]|uniref:ATP-binding protein n=1 Tax=Mycobacterium sp. TaxID=1785 RepID=UPI003BAA2AD0
MDPLPADSWLTDLGGYSLPSPAHRTERVIQLSHCETESTYSLPRTLVAAESNLPVQFTTLVGRDAQILEVGELLAKNRLVTLHGEGGVGKTRLAIQIAATSEFRDDARFVDLASIADPALVFVTAAHAMGMIDQPNGATLDALGRLIGNRHILMLLDNCEHLLDACAELIVALLGTCPGLKVLATSREPIALAGEVTWRVPGLSPDDAAIELFTDRARLVKPAFEITDKNSKAVREICQRLDGIPLAIELAAARVRSLSVAELASGLDDRFGLLTSSARAVVRRQRTLRASLDWSYARLTQPEQVLFRRLAVFTGGFDFAAVVEVVAARSDDLVERYQVLDQLTLLVDKCLVVAEDWRGAYAIPVAGNGA